MKKKKKKESDITIGDLLIMEFEYIRAHLFSSFNANSTSLDYWYSMAFAQGHISLQNKRNLTTELKQKLSMWRLTRFEMLMLLCYMGNLSEVFDKGDPNTSPYPINEMCKAMDRVLIKAPACTSITTLYRQCRHEDITYLKKGEFVTIPHYLTTSINNWNQPNNQLIIKPKKDGTNAKALYKMRNKNNEFQVTFKRGTTFLVEEVQPFEMDGTVYKRILMNEI